MELKSPITNEYFSSFDICTPQSYDSLLRLYEENWPGETAYHGNQNQADKADIASFLDTNITASECESKHPPWKPYSSPLRLPSPIKDVMAVDPLEKKLPSSPTSTSFCIESILADKLQRDKQRYDDRENLVVDVEGPENLNNTTSPVASPGCQENPIDVESLLPDVGDNNNTTYEHEQPARGCISTSTATTTNTTSNDYHYTSPYGYPKLTRLTHNVSADSYSLMNSSFTGKKTVKKTIKNTGRKRIKTSYTTSSSSQPNIAPTHNKSTINYYPSPEEMKKVTSTQKKTKSQVKPVDYHQQQQQICLIPISPSVVTRNLFPSNVTLTSNGVIYPKPTPLQPPKFNLKYYPTTSKKQTYFLPNVLYQPPPQQQKNNTFLYYQEPIKHAYTQHWINTHQVPLLNHTNNRQIPTDFQRTYKAPCQPKPIRCCAPTKSSTTRIIPSSSSLSHGVSNLISKHSQYATPTSRLVNRACPPPLSHPHELTYGKYSLDFNKATPFMNKSNVLQPQPAQNVDERIYLTMPVLTKQGSCEIVNNNTGCMNSWETSLKRPATTHETAPSTRSSSSKTLSCYEDMVMESDFEVSSLFNSKLDKKQYPDSQSEIEAIKKKLMIEFEKSKTPGKKDIRTTSDPKNEEITCHYTSMMVEKKQKLAQKTTKEVGMRQQKNNLTKGDFQRMTESNTISLSEKKESIADATFGASSFFKDMNQSSTVVDDCYTDEEEDEGDEDEYDFDWFRRRVMRENTDSQHKMTMRKRCFTTTTTNMNSGTNETQPAAKTKKLCQYSLEPPEESTRKKKKKKVNNKTMKKTILQKDAKKKRTYTKRKAKLKAVVTLHKDGMSVDGGTIDLSSRVKESSLNDQLNMDSNPSRSEGVVQQHQQFNSEPTSRPLADDQQLTFSKASDQPSMANDQLSLANNQPLTSSAASDQPSLHNDQPSFDNDKSLTSTEANDQPALASDQPSLTNDQQSTSSEARDQLAFHNDHPSSDNDRSLTSTEANDQPLKFSKASDQLSSANDKSLTSLEASDHPSLHNDQPSLHNDQPSSDNNKSLTSTEANDQPALPNTQPSLANDQQLTFSEASNQSSFDNDKSLTSTEANDQPAVASDQPSLANDHSLASSEAKNRPALQNNHSSSDNDRSLTYKEANDQPTLDNDRPLRFLGANDQPLTSSESNDQPSLDNNQPVTSSEANGKPALYNDQPALYNDQPSLINDQPLTSSESKDQPTLANSTPLTSSKVNNQYALANDKSSSDNDRPLTFTEANNQPALADDQPILANNQPLTSTEANEQLALDNDRSLISLGANEQSTLANDQPVTSSKSNDKPALANDQPLTSTVTNDQSTLANDQSALANDQSVLANDQPNLANDQPLTSTEANDQPALDNDQPEASSKSNDKPTLANDQPLTSTATNDQSTLANDQSALANDQTNLANDQPLTSTEANDQPALDNDQTETSSKSNDKPALTNEPLTSTVTNDQSTLANDKSLTSSKANDQLALANDQPALANDQPLTSTATNDQSTLANDQSALANDQPNLANDQPLTSTEANDQPALDNDQPEMSSKSNDKPALANDQPLTSTITNDQSTLAKDKSLTSSKANDQLALANDQPLTSTESKDQTLYEHKLSKSSESNSQSAFDNDKATCLESNDDTALNYGPATDSEIIVSNNIKNMSCSTKQAKRKSTPCKSIYGELNKKKKRKDQNLTVSFVKNIDIFPKHLLLPDGPPDTLVKSKIPSKRKEKRRELIKPKKVSKVASRSAETPNELSDKKIQMTNPEVKKKRGRPRLNKEQISLKCSTKPTKRKSAARKSIDGEETNNKRRKEDKTCSVSFVNTNTTRRIISKDLPLSDETSNKPQPKHSTSKKKEKNNESIKKKMEKPSSKKKELQLIASLKKVKEQLVTNHKTPTITLETPNPLFCKIDVGEKTKSAETKIVKSAKTEEHQATDVEKKAVSKKSILPGGSQIKLHSKLFSVKRQEKDSKTINKKIMKSQTKAQNKTFEVTSTNSALPSEKLHDKPQSKLSSTKKKDDNYEIIKKKIMKVVIEEQNRTSEVQKTVRPKKTRKMKTRKSQKVNPYTIKRFPQCKHGRRPSSRKIQFEFDGETRSVLTTESLEISLSQQRVITMIQLDDFPPSPTITDDVNGVVYAYQQQQQSAINGKIHG